MIENADSVACTVFVSSPEGEQRFELAIGESITATGITERIEVAGVSLSQSQTSFERPLLDT